VPVEKGGGSRCPHLYLGMLSGRAGPGRASKKPDSKICYPGPTRPGCRASFFCPSPARRAKIVSGRRAGPSLISRFSLPKPGPLLLSGLKFLPRPGPIACFGPTGRAIFGPGRSGRASHAQVYFGYTSFWAPIWT
jgi:hypothetical protein